MTLHVTAHSVCKSGGGGEGEVGRWEWRHAAGGAQLSLARAAQTHTHTHTYTHMHTHTNTYAHTCLAQSCVSPPPSCALVTHLALDPEGRVAAVGLTATANSFRNTP